MFGSFAWVLESRIKDGEGRDILRTLCLLWERSILDGEDRLGHFINVSGN